MGSPDPLIRTHNIGGDAMALRIGGVLLTLILGLASSHGAYAADEPFPLKIIVEKSSLSTVIHQVAVDGGYYAKNGLDVELVLLVGAQELSRTFDIGGRRLSLGS